MYDIFFYSKDHKVDLYMYFIVLQLVKATSEFGLVSVWVMFQILAKRQNTWPLIDISLNRKGSHCVMLHSTKRFDT